MDDATTYPPEPWHLTGRGWVTTWRVPLPSLPPLPEGTRPLAARGTALAVTGFVSYEPPGQMAYAELLAAVVVRHGGRVRLSITDIWVDSPASREGGRGLWGIPKDLAVFTVRDGSRSAGTEDGRPLAAVRPGRGRLPAVPLPLPLSGRVVQTLDGRTVATRVRTTGRVRPTRHRWELPDDGPLAWLRHGTPVASLSAESFAMTFGS